MGNRTHRPPWTGAALLALLTLVPGGLSGEEGPLRLDHAPRPCVRAESFPLIEARLEPADVPKAELRVFFHADGGPDWYFVGLAREGERWRGALPRPRPGTRRIGYYLVARSAGATVRLPETSAFLLEVVTSPCAEGNLETGDHGPTMLGVPPGAARRPVGFESEGIQAWVEAAWEVEPIPAGASPAPAPRFRRGAVFPALKPSTS